MQASIRFDILQFDIIYNRKCKYKTLGGLFYGKIDGKVLAHKGNYHRNQLFK